MGLHGVAACLSRRNSDGIVTRIDRYGIRDGTGKYVFWALGLHGGGYVSLGERNYRVFPSGKHRHCCLASKTTGGFDSRKVHFGSVTFGGKYFVLVTLRLPHPE